ncbi:hypothetical protein MMC07_003726 [Pseudocyphellaria aurata]|nr:hypothetical protein [Pseudocyphellaria aurata]
MSSKPRVIYWFRTDLRLHDSPALKAALDLKPECLYPVWCWDPHYVYRARVGPNRWQYLYMLMQDNFFRLDCQSDLSESITKLNPKSKLFVVREAPQTVLVKLFRAWKISHLVFEKDTDAYARSRDEKIMEIAKEAGVKVITKVGRTLYDPDELVRANGGNPTMSITQVQNASKKLPDIPRPIPTPKSIPDPGNTSFDFDHVQPPRNPDFNSSQRSSEETSYANLAGPSADFAVPEMAELGLKPASTPHRGGETLALAALLQIIENKDYTATFSKPDTAPTAFSPQSTTLLSPHLHFGSLSVREFYWRAHDVIVTYKAKKAATIPTNLLGQLLFRDMYFGAQAALGYLFAQTHNNPNCRFIPWHLPSTISSGGLVTGTYRVNNPQAEEWFRRWKFGITGFPWIDALMRQLRTEGWIHHLGRHAVACFLTRGGCYVDWERGAEVFEEWLIDHETACNAGNWQWLSCSAFYAQFYRCYSPVAFPKKWDKGGAFVRKYVPELENYGEKYIYEPWKAPLVDQKGWGCLIKGDGDREKKGEETKYKHYPKPMFDFDERRSICIEGVKGAYKVDLHGADEKVQDGSWRELFPAGAEGAVEESIDQTVEGSTEQLHEDKKPAQLTHSAGIEGNVKATLPSTETDDDQAAADGDEKIDDGARKITEQGGETKGGDNSKKKKAADQSATKRKRQGTLDGVLVQKRGKTHEP